MVRSGERWPPVYDLDALLADIRDLTSRPDIESAFYEWRRDRSTEVQADVCQGDIIALDSEVPVILEDGKPGIVAHPEGVWLVIGNTCDFDRTLEEVRWTQLVPIHKLGGEHGLDAQQLASVRRYTQSRTFFVPSWSATTANQVHVADLLRPVGVDKRNFSGPNAQGVVQARLARPAWILLNACLVRFLARDDGRYA